MRDKKAIAPVASTSFVRNNDRDQVFSMDSEPGLSKREAVALSYMARSGNPRVVAKGRGLIAEEIVRKASDNGVFVYESRELLLALSHLKLDDEISREIYETLAAIIVWIGDAEAGSDEIYPGDDEKIHSANNNPLLL